MNARNLIAELEQLSSDELYEVQCRLTALKQKHPGANSLHVERANGQLLLAGARVIRQTE
jgi:hypothetical protein